MVKLPKPNDFDEIRKRGSSDRHIVKRVADTALEGGLDSDREDSILEAWIEAVKPDDVSQFQSYKRQYPLTSNGQLQNYLLVYKEVELGGFRIDSVIRTPDGKWKLIEVKTQDGLGLGVIGHLLSKRSQFENIFTVSPNDIEMSVLTDNGDDSFQSVVTDVNDQYEINIKFDQVQVGNDQA